MKQSIKEIIIETLASDNGLKTVKLVLEVMRRLMPAVFTSNQFQESLNELLEEGNVMRLQYTDSEEGVKLMFFRKGTTFLIPDSIKNKTEKPIAHVDPSQETVDRTG